MSSISMDDSHRKSLITVGRQLESLYDIVATRLAYNSGILTSKRIKLMPLRCVYRLVSYLSSYDLDRVNECRPDVDLRLLWILHRSFTWQHSFCISSSPLVGIDINPRDEYYLTNYIYAGQRDIVIAYRDTWDGVNYLSDLSVVPLFVLSTCHPVQGLAGHQHDARIRYLYVNRFSITGVHLVPSGRNNFFPNHTRSAFDDIRRNRMRRLVSCSLYTRLQTTIPFKFRVLHVSPEDQWRRLNKVKEFKPFRDFYKRLLQPNHPAAWLMEPQEVHMDPHSLRVYYHLPENTCLNPDCSLSYLELSRDVIGKYSKPFDVISDIQTSSQLNVRDSLAIGAMAPLPRILHSSWTCKALSAALDAFLLNSTTRQPAPQFHKNRYLQLLQYDEDPLFRIQQAANVKRRVRTDKSIWSRVNNYTIYNIYLHNNSLYVDDLNWCTSNINVGDGTSNPNHNFLRELKKKTPTRNKTPENMTMLKHV